MSGAIAPVVAPSPQATIQLSAQLCAHWASGMVNAAPVQTQHNLQGQRMTDTKQQDPRGLCSSLSATRGSFPALLSNLRHPETPNWYLIARSPECPVPTFNSQHFANIGCVLFWQTFTNRLQRL